MLQFVSILSLSFDQIQISVVEADLGQDQWHEHVETFSLILEQDPDSGVLSAPVLKVDFPYQSKTGPFNNLSKSIGQQCIT